MLKVMGQNYGCSKFLNTKTMTKMEILRKASVHEFAILQKMCNDTYITYFEDHWEAEGLTLYLEEQFGTERLTADLESDFVDYYFICFQENPVGYLKINYDTKLKGFENKTVCELEKMYLLPEFKRKGIGQLALQTIKERLRQKGFGIFFLCVLDTNDHSILFYEKIGFSFHSKIRLKYIHFKEALKGLNRMYVELN